MNNPWTASPAKR